MSWNISTDISFLAFQKKDIVFPSTIKRIPQQLVERNFKLYTKALLLHAPLLSDESESLTN